jgi:peptide methionine sulfoxide reductase MsrA
VIFFESINKKDTIFTTNKVRKQIILGENIKPDRISNEIVEKIKAENEPCRYFIYSENSAKTYCHKKWETKNVTDVP